MEYLFYEEDQPFVGVFRQIGGGSLKRAFGGPMSRSPESPYCRRSPTLQ
jgi:hypothetical protein